jgi:peptidoglycan/LPS O-acetylase OafA/YrhL
MTREGVALTVPVESRTLDPAQLESRMIDVLRGIAILLVVLVHTWLYVLAPTVTPISARAAALFSITGFGAAGVGLFFVISGYLLNLLYAGPSFTPRKYWVRRAARIYPAWVFWTVVAVVSAIVAARFTDGTGFYGSSVVPNTLGNIGLLLLHLAFFGFLAPTIWNSVVPGGWSIQAEIFNYVLYPIMRRMRFSTVLLAVLAIELAQFAIFSFPNAISTSGDWTRIVSTYLTSPVWFVLGMFLSRVAGSARNKRPVVDWPMEASLMAACLGLPVLLGLSGPFVSQATTLAVVLGGIALAYLLVRSQRWKFVALVGNYSYGVYFAHFLVLGPLASLVTLVAEAVGDRAIVSLSIPIFVVGYLLILFTALAVARIVFELVERRPIEWARRTGRRVTSR